MHGENAHMKATRPMPLRGWNCMRAGLFFLLCTALSPVHAHLMSAGHGAITLQDRSALVMLAIPVYQAAAVGLPLALLLSWQRVDLRRTFAVRWPVPAPDGALWRGAAAIAGSALVGCGLFVVGAAAMLAAESRSPGELRAAVTSKGGTTAAALAVFDSQQMGETIRTAMLAACERGRELGRGD